MISIRKLFENNATCMINRSKGMLPHSPMLPRENRIGLNRIKKMSIKPPNVTY